MDYLPWLLRELKQRSDIDGRRVIDVFTVHYYPQGGEFWPDGDVSPAMQLRRNRSTRSLWDPNYIDETWINDRVQLIPRLRNLVTTYYYASTPIGITEYNWGAENHINGATTQADIYGIFGREGLDMGARWTTPATSTPTYKAMKMYRNYDGNRSTFGDTSVRTISTANPDNLSVFAAERSSDGAVTVMVISKVLSGSTPVSLNLANFAPGAAAQAWQLTSSNTITRLADVARVRPGIHGNRAGSERHALRRAFVRRAVQPAARCQCDRNASVRDSPAHGGVRWPRLIGSRRLDRQLRVDVWRRRHCGWFDDQPYVSGRGQLLGSTHGDRQPGRDSYRHAFDRRQSRRHRSGCPIELDCGGRLGPRGDTELE